ncbi:MAG: copper amine oxidase N-terminal domain-containing protein [Thermoanaerobacteraceae bacterium]|nr:copper amine oxidase N-terminal domain-containing protein [Thermoanaerobacteraceae bacterium]
MKRLLFITLISVVMVIGSLTLPAFPQEQPEIPVLLDGLPVTFDVQPVIQNGRTLVPFRAIAEALNIKVTWDDAAQTVNASDGKTSIQLQIGNKTAYRNESPIPFDVPPQILGGRTLIPLRFFSEAFNCKVEWDSSLGAVLITSPPKEMVVIGFYALGDSRLVAPEVLGRGKSIGPDIALPSSGYSANKNTEKPVEENDTEIFSGFPSPDGRWKANYERSSSEENQTGIWITDVQSGITWRASSGLPPYGAMLWGPNNRLYYPLMDKEHPKVTWFEAGPTQKEVKPFLPDLLDGKMASVIKFSPDGKKVLFATDVSWSNVPRDIDTIRYWIVDIDGKNLHYLGRGPSAIKDLK